MSLAQLTAVYDVEQLRKTPLSANFKVYESLVTNHTKFAEEQLLYFVTNPRLWFNAARLACEVLQPIRAQALGNKGFSPTSWGRCPGLNAALPGSSTTSLHCEWLAADLVFGDRKQLEAVWTYLALSDVAGESILYLGADGKATRIHVAARVPKVATGERFVKLADGSNALKVPRGAFVA